jgi:hypothetical protein
LFAGGALLLTFDVPEDEAQFLAKVGEVGDEVKARSDAFAEGLGDLIKKVFAFRRVICDAGLCSVSSELGEEGRVP